MRIRGTFHQVQVRKKSLNKHLKNLILKTFTENEWEMFTKVIAGSSFVVGIQNTY